MPVAPTFDILTATLGTAVNAGQTITFAYPAGKAAADYVTAGAVLSVPALQVQHTLAATLGGSVTVTYPAGRPPIPPGTVYLQLTRSNVGEDITLLTAASGTASDTIADVTASPTQALINNNFASVSAKINRILRLLENKGLTA